MMPTSNLESLLRRAGTPVAIGAVGGSGTRLVAQIVEAMGVDLGRPRNRSEDHLWFSLLFKRPGILRSTDDEFDQTLRIFLEGTVGAGRFELADLRRVRQFASAHDQPLKVLAKCWPALIPRWGSPTDSARAWGWKEPNTHVVLHRLEDRFERLRYIHVMRSGFDMAHSSNQNQLRMWGVAYLGEAFSQTPFFSLKYWHRVHRRVLEIGASMGDRFLLLNFDDLCLEPQRGIERIADFLGQDISSEEIAALRRRVKPPDSIGRFRDHGLAGFDPEDLAFAAGLGFTTDIDLTKHQPASPLTSAAATTAAPSSTPPGVPQ